VLILHPMIHSIHGFQTMNHSWMIQSLMASSISPLDPPMIHHSLLYLSIFFVLNPPPPLFLSIHKTFYTNRNPGFLHRSIVQYTFTISNPSGYLYTRHSFRPWKSNTPRPFSLHCCIQHPQQTHLLPPRNQRSGITTAHSIPRH
jgi:hypothetical protein